MTQPKDLSLKLTPKQRAAVDRFFNRKNACSGCFKPLAPVGERLIVGQPMSKKALRENHKGLFLASMVCADCAETIRHRMRQRGLQLFLEKR